MANGLQMRLLTVISDIVLFAVPVLVYVLIISFENLPWARAVLFLYPIAVIITLVKYRPLRNLRYRVLWYISTLLFFAATLPNIHPSLEEAGGAFIGAILLALMFTVLFYRLILAVLWGARTLKGWRRASSSTS